MKARGIHRNPVLAGSLALPGKRTAPKSLALPGKLIAPKSLAPLLALALLLPSPFLGAQQSNTFYLMQDVPQNTLLNPAVQIPCRLYVGIPVLTSLHASYGNTAFGYQDIAGEGFWDIQALQDQSHRADLYALETQVSLIGLGYRHRLGYFTFHVRERGLFYQTVPGDLVDLALDGNGPYAGERLTFNGFRPMGIHAREYSLGISREAGPYLNLGLRAKLLFGKANVSTARTRASLATAQDNFSLEVESDYTLNTSFPYTILLDAEGNPDGIELGEVEALPYLLNRSNPGLAIDLGMTYAYDDHITLSASLLDVGFIRWRSDVNNIRGEGTYTNEGIDLYNQPGTESYIWEALDSIATEIDVSTGTSAYTSLLPAQLYLAGEYQYNEQLSFGLVNRNLLFRSKWHASFSLVGKATLARRFSTTLSWSYLNNSIANVGVGLAYVGKGLQVHAVTDNLLAAFYPFDTRTVNVRVGVNLLLGCPRNRKERLEMNSGRRIPEGNCPVYEDAKKKRKRMMKAARRINR